MKLASHVGAAGRERWRGEGVQRAAQLEAQLQHLARTVERGGEGRRQPALGEARVELGARRGQVAALEPGEPGRGQQHGVRQFRYCAKRRVVQGEGSVAFDFAAQPARGLGVRQEREARVAVAVQGVAPARRGANQEIDARAAIHQHRMDERAAACGAHRARRRNAFFGEPREAVALPLPPPVVAARLLRRRQGALAQGVDVAVLIQLAPSSPVAQLHVHAQMRRHRFRLPGVLRNVHAACAPQRRRERWQQLAAAVGSVGQQLRQNAANSIRRRA